MKTLLVLSFALIASSAQAALPPGAESLRRIAAIATSSDVFKAIGNSGWISSITDNGDGNYSVVSSTCALSVKVKSVSNGRVGPGELKILVGQTVCLPK